MPTCVQDSTITLSNYNAPYVGPSCLNSTWSPTQSLSNTDMEQWVTTLISRELASAPGAAIDNQGNFLSQTDINSAQTFATSSAALRRKINIEYCYYYNCYIVALTELLNRATSSDAPSTYAALKTNTQNLNGKLNQIIQVLQALSANRLVTLSTYYGTSSGVNKINNDLNGIRDKLQSNAKALNDSQMQTNVKTALMNYTIEKNNSSRNLLAIYGFLNIVAVGTLFYLYRNMKS
jgi:hypothetical protein